MKPIELTILNDGSFVLQGKGSELLILAEHTYELSRCKVPKDFATYFMTEALVNRPARKMFESWLRKDSELWRKIFKAVHEQLTEDQAKSAHERWKSLEDLMKEDDIVSSTTTTQKKSEPEPKKNQTASKLVEQKKAAQEKSKTTVKTEDKKKPESKSASASKSTKKPAEKKPAAKKSATTKTAKKTEAKKTAKKAVKKKKA